MQIILHFLTIFGCFLAIPRYFLAYAAQKKATTRRAVALDLCFTVDYCAAFISL